MTFKEFAKEFPDYNYQIYEKEFNKYSALYYVHSGPNLRTDFNIESFFIQTLMEFKGSNLMDQLQKLATLRLTIAKAKFKE